MKKQIFIAFLISYGYSFGQKSLHGLYLGSNLTTTNLDLSPLGITPATYGGFKSSKIGFIVGYKYILPLSAKVSLSTGLEVRDINCKFSRPHYNDPNYRIDPNLTTVYEKLSFTRLSIPIQGYYNFFNRGKLSLYFTAGVECLLLNDVKRKVDYQIPGPPLGYVNGTFTGNQKFNFNNDKQLGIGASIGLGTEFRINEQSYFIEASFYRDISENKIFTLKNIEADSYFYSALKSFQLKIGHTFSFSKKK